jgi:hypothetical protein
MATLTTAVITRAGVTYSVASAAGGGDAMACGSGAMLVVTNNGGAPITVTFTIPAARTYEPNMPITNLAVSVAAGTAKWIGPIDAQTFADPVTGLCTITYSGVTSVFVVACQLVQP